MDRTQAIILKKINLGEFDELVICYSKDFGKIKVLARGIHQKSSKQKSHLDVLALSDFLIVRGKNKDTVRSALSLNKFLKIKSNLKLSALGFGALELIDKTIFENQPDPAVWELLTNYLNYLNNIPDSMVNNLDTSGVLSIFHSFFVSFVKIHGHNETNFRLPGRPTLNSYLESVSNFIKSDFQKPLSSLQFLKKVILLT